MHIFSRQQVSHLAALATLFFTLVVAGCGVPGVVAKGHSLPPATPTATAVPLAPLQLPQDEAPHTNLTEWWYYTGHFHNADNSKNYGFELTFFQVLRGNFGPVYVGHYAISDITRGDFQFDQRTILKLGASLPAGTTTGFNLAINDWTMQGLNGHDQLAAAMQNYAINLTLDSQKPAALHNGSGLLSYGPGGYSYYYSRTHMAVSGTIQDHGVAVPVTGLAWMDHQWGNFITVNGTGWDWFSIQLDNGTDYMVYEIRDTTGKVISVIGSLIDAQGKTTQVDATKISEAVNGHWVSPTTHYTYPSGWTLTLPNGSLTITPTLPNQELVTTQTTGNTYWEGDSSVTGTIDGQPVTGQGYTELTGYTH